MKVRVEKFCFNLRLKSNHFLISDGLRIQVNLTLNFLLKKLQNSITEKHPEAKRNVILDEIEIDFSEEVQREGDKNNESKIGPIAAEMTHQMRWIQEHRQVSLVGYGWNYYENLESNPRFSKMTILMARFEDNTQLSSSIKIQEAYFCFFLEGPHQNKHVWC